MEKNGMRALTISYFGCIDPKYSRNKTNIDGLRAVGVTVHEVIVSTPVTPLNAATHIGAFPLIKRVLHKFKILPLLLTKHQEIMESDAIFVGYPGQFDMPFAYLIAKFYGKKLVFDPVILMFNALSNDIGVIKKGSFSTNLLKCFEKYIMSLPDVIIASTIEQKKFFIDQVEVREEKIKVAYLAADNAIYKPVETKRKVNKFKVVYYGLFTPLHGIPHIIEAARMCQSNQNIVFQMVGKGQLYQESRARADKAGLTNIEFYPDMNESNSMELLQQADVFLGFMESNDTVLREIPNKVYQGMALGTVVITGDSPAIRTVFTNRENIYIVPVANGAALAEAILDMAEHPELAEKIKSNSYNLFNSRFTPKAIGGVLKAQILELTKGEYLKSRPALKH